MTSTPDILSLARRHAETGQLAACRALCLRLAADCPDDLPTQLDIGALFSTYGFLADARACYTQQGRTGRASAKPIVFPALKPN